MKAIETATNVAILAMAAVIVARYGTNLYAGKTANARPPIYAKGELIKSAAGLDFKAAPKTLLLVTSSHCTYCTASMGYYVRLTASAERAGLRVVSVSPEDPSLNRQYLTEHHVQFDAVVPAKECEIRYRGTPTLILVGRDSRVLGSWTGQLGKEGEEQVLLALSINAEGSRQGGRP